MEGNDLDGVAELLSCGIDELLDRGGRILHELLVEEAALLVEGAQLAGKNLLQQGFRLTFCDELGFRDFLFLRDERGIQR